MYAAEYGHGYTTILPPGVSAPDFCKPVFPDQKICLHEMKGNPVVLIFYPADWEPAGAEQLAILDAIKPDLDSLDARLIGVSADAPWSHYAFITERHLHFPLISDFEPKGEVAKKYGVYDEKTGQCDRAIFVIDKEGVIFWSYLSPLGTKPGADGILDALEKLKQK